MGGIITTGAHPKELWPGVHAFWDDAYAEHSEEFKDLFNIETSSKNYEEDVQNTTFGLAPVKAQGQPVVYDSDSQGYLTRYTHVVYGLGYIVTKEEIEDNLYLEVSKRRAKNLAFSMRQTKEIIAANVYNRAFNASYVGGDGVSLLNAAHPNTSGGTYSNVLSVSSDLSESSLEDMCILVAGFTNDRGLLVNILPQKLIVSRSDWFNANRILKSTQQAGTANNDINALRATNALPGGIVMNHYLTDQNAWFIRTNAPQGLTHFVRRAVQFTQDNDFDTENAKAKATERYSFGWTNPRGLVGSPGST